MTAVKRLFHSVRTCWSLPFLFLLCVVPLSICSGSKRLSGNQVAEAIKHKFDTALSSLEPDIRRHYATRMFRWLGDSTYIPEIAEDVCELADSVIVDIKAVNDTNYVIARADALLADFNEWARKGKQRSTYFSSHKRLLFDLDVLYKCATLRSHGLLMDSAFSPMLSDAVEYLRTRNLEIQLLDPKLIRIYAAQVANAVYYLEEVGLADIRLEFNAEFKATFPDSKDDLLSTTEFEDKLYGLTHIVIAASGYYQHTVPAEDYRWILSYFSENLEAILLEARADIVAEIGLCYLLSGLDKSTEVSRCRKHLESKFDSGSRIIASESGSHDLDNGEHRNVLAIMLLTDHRDLHSGPNLLLLKRWAKLCHPE